MVAGLILPLCRRLGFLGGETGDGGRLGRVGLAVVVLLLPWLGILVSPGHEAGVVDPAGYMGQVAMI